MRHARREDSPEWCRRAKLNETHIQLIARGFFPAPIGVYVRMQRLPECLIQMEMVSPEEIPMIHSIELKKIGEVTYVQWERDDQLRMLPGWAAMHGELRLAESHSLTVALRPPSNQITSCTRLKHLVD